MQIKKTHIFFIAIISGIFLLISGVNGIVTWETIKDFVIKNIIDNLLVQILFAILIFFASLGGISVIIGGFFIWKKRFRIGKFMISLGAGLGIIGLIFSIILMITENSFTISSFISIGSVGIILSIIARLLVKKVQ